MNKINFYISDEDMIKHLELKRERGNILVSDPLFIRYLSEYKNMNKDQLEILVNKYCDISSNCIDGVYTTYGIGYNTLYPVNDYEKFIAKNNKLDARSITHMYFPINRYYNLSIGEIRIKDIESIIMDISLNMGLDEKTCLKMIKVGIQDYKLAGKIVINPENKLKDESLLIKLENSEALKYIDGYQKLYGNNNFEKVKRNLIERV